MTRLDRRDLLAGIGVSALALACPQCAARAAGRIENVLCATKDFSGLEYEELLRTSGSASLDQSLISEMNKQSAFFGFRPAFVIYSGGSKNAAATPDVMPGMPGTDGTILYSLDLMQEQLKVGKWGGAILSGVIAHEFGHIYQSFTNAMPRLRARAETLKFVELHADFLSGF